MQAYLIWTIASVGSLISNTFYADISFAVINRSFHAEP